MPCAAAVCTMLSTSCVSIHPVSDPSVGGLIAVVISKHLMPVLRMPASIGGRLVRTWAGSTWPPGRTVRLIAEKPISLHALPRITPVSYGFAAAYAAVVSHWMFFEKTDHWMRGAPAARAL